MWYSDTTETKPLAIIQRQCTVCGQEARLRLTRQDRSGCLWIIPFSNSTYELQCGICFRATKISNNEANQIIIEATAEKAKEADHVYELFETKYNSFLSVRKAIIDKKLSDIYVRDWFKNRYGVKISIKEFSNWVAPPKCSLVVTPMYIGIDEPPPLNRLTTEQLQHFLSTIKAKEGILDGKN